MTLVALVSILLFLFSFSIKTTTTVTDAHCLTDQRHALIKLKQGFKTTKLHSWDASTDCCNWDGIECDEQTGMVTALNLFNRSIAGELNPAFFNLSSLRYLNLAENHFINVSLPQTGFERLANLTHLDISLSGFAGQVPISFSALTNLISLNLSYNNLYLPDTGLQTLLRNHTKLQVLRLDGVDISLNGSELSSAIFQIATTLQELSMGDCELSGNFPDEVFHLTNLTELDLSENRMLSGQLPELKKQSFLQSLNLGFTNFTGPLPNSIGILQYLVGLALFGCNFYGEIPPSITNLTRLEYLDLDTNILTGTIPMSLFSHPSLVFLVLNDNQLSGYLPEFSNGSSILQHVFIANNNLQGQLSFSIFNSPQLIDLYFPSNNFSGTFNLDVIKHNKKLGSLDLSYNKLSIIEGKNHKESFYASFPQMTDLILASCNLTNIPYFLRYQKNIGQLDLSNNKIGGAIPNWLCRKTSIQNLNLSHNFFTEIEEGAHFTSLDIMDFLDINSNRLKGPVPLLPPGIVFADLSSNYLFSWPSYFISSPIYLSLSNNRLTGEIPLSICNVSLPEPEIFDPSFPKVLDLSYNNLTGTMPPCLLEDAQFREVLILKNNKLSGPLPWNINHGCKLRTINLSGNRINGCLPQSLLNCDNLEVLDLGNNQIVDRFPFWLSNLKNLGVLVLRSNQFFGTISNIDAKTEIKNSFFPKIKVFDLSSNHFRGIIPKIVFQKLKAMLTNSDSSIFPLTYFMNGNTYYYQNSITVIWKGQEMEIKKSLSIFSSLDLSQNGFSGEIPEEIGQLKSLDVLNLSHNTLTGPIPSEFANLHQLQSLDLSFNQLSGDIPQELTSLTFLSVLNLSYNKLVGEIPEAHQFSTYSNASYLGNPGLCGTPLSMFCATPSNDEFNNDLLSKSSSDIIGLSVSIGLGLGVGFASVIWVLISWGNGREWFNFIVDRFYFRHIPWIVLHLCLAIGRE